MFKIEYIGIVVKDLVISNELFVKLLGWFYYKIEEVVSEYVNIFFF